MSSLVYLRNKKNNRIYVYNNVKEGIDENGKPIYSRRCIGHLDEISGEIVPNQIRSASPSAKLRYAALSECILHISDKIGLTHTLKVTFGTLWKDIITCAMYGLTGNTDLTSVEKWTQKFDTPSGKTLNPKRIMDIIDSIDEEGIDAFQRIWRKKVKDRNILHISSSPMMNFDHHEFNYSGGASTSDMIMTADMDVCYGADTFLPISYAQLSGKVLSLEEIIKSEDRYHWINPSGILYILNEEYCEGNNVDVLVVSDRRFVIRLPLRHALFKKITTESQDEIMTFSNYKGSTGGSNFITTQIVDISGTHCFAHMYYSAESAENEIGSFLTLIEKCRKELETDHIVITHTEIYGKFFSIDENTSEVVLNSNAIMEHTKNAGISIILSDVIADPVLALEYMNLNLFAERTFDNLLNNKDRITLRLYLKHNLEARCFIQFITLILRSAIRKMLSDNKLRSEYTVEDVVREINNIAQIEMSDRKNTIKSEMNPRQKLFLNLVGVSADSE